MKLIIVSVFCILTVSSLPQQPFGVDIGPGQSPIGGGIQNSPLGIPQNNLPQNNLLGNSNLPGALPNSLPQNGFNFPGNSPGLGANPPAIAKRGADQIEQFRQFTIHSSTLSPLAFPGQPQPAFPGQPQPVFPIQPQPPLIGSIPNMKRSAADLSGRTLGTGSPVPRVRRGLFGGDDLTTLNVLIPKVVTIPTGYPKAKREISVATSTPIPLASRQKRGLFGSEQGSSTVLPLSATLSSTTRAARR